MRYIVVLFLLVVTTVIQAQEIKWMTMGEALAAQEKEPRKIIMDAYTVWCGPCKLLDKNTFTNPDLVNFVNENYYPVKFNAEGAEEINYKGEVYSNPNHDPARATRRNSQHHFASALGLQGYPSIVFFDEKGGFIQPIVGYFTAQQLEIYLKMIENDDYKTLITQEAWQSYQEEFVGTFKG